MKAHSSPWIHQLKRTRPVTQLAADTRADVVIVGGGIAGVMTAYFTLAYTNRSILLVEGSRVAHGATGHNAGQLVSYFEKSFTEMVEEFGLSLAAHGQGAVESAWLLIEEIFQEARLTTPCTQFVGYAGCIDYDEVLSRLKDNMLRVQGGLAPERLLIAEEAPYAANIPAMYASVYSLVPHKSILALLETNDSRYTATLASRKGCMNSALFCEEVVEYLLKTFQGRFLMVEQTLVAKVQLDKKQAKLVTDSYTITAKQVVLCTNGFENFTITNTEGPDIDTKFHHLVRGSVGYMAGFLEEVDKSPTAISYLPERKPGDQGAFDAEPYFYITRRPYESEKIQRHNVVCVGGPESLMDDTNNYKREHPYPVEANKAIDEFVRKTYKHAPKKITYAFKWHGLMGYTPNGVRCIGFEPCNPVLLYNLGCNGVGILPSVYGGRRIASLLGGEDIGISIFDPRDKSCRIPVAPRVSHQQA